MITQSSDVKFRKIRKAEFDSLKAGDRLGIGAFYEAEGRLYGPGGRQVVTRPLDAEAFLPAEMVAFFASPFVSRSAIAARGGLQGLSKLPLESAIVVDGNDATALTNAITAAAALTVSPKVIVLRQDVTITSSVTLTSGLTLMSDNGSKIISANSSALLMSSNSEVRGVCFDGSQVRYVNSTQQSRIRIFANRFVNTPGNGAILDNSTADNTMHSWNYILWNEWDHSNYGTYLQRSQRTLVAFNRFIGDRGVGRGIYAVCTHTSIFEYNWVSGGITGIGWLPDRQIWGGPRDNIVRFNYVENVSDEGLTIDAYASNASQMAAVDRLLVSSVSGSAGSSPSVICARSAATGINGAGANSYILVTTGSLAGRAFRIASGNTDAGAGNVRIQLTNNCITTAELAALVGQHIVIQIIATRNLFHNNYVKDTRWPIVGWGMMHECVIANNIMDNPGDVQAISITSVGGVSSSAALNAVGGAEGLCINVSARNFIFNNKVINVSDELRDSVVGMCTGQAYSVEAGVTPFIDAMPNYASGNNFPIVGGKWKNKMYNLMWTSTEDAAVITDYGDPFVEQMIHDWANAERPPNERSLWDPTERGQHVASGTGAATTFNIPHSLGIAPRIVNVTAMSAAAAGFTHITVSATNITVNYSAAPASGTNNLTFAWSAEV